MFERPALYACRAAAQHISYRDDAAIGDALRALNWIPKDALTWYVVGRIHYCWDEKSVARSAFKLCRAAASRATLAWHLTESLLEAGQLDESEFDLQPAESMDYMSVMKQMSQRQGIDFPATSDSKGRHISRNRADFEVRTDRLSDD